MAITIRATCSECYHEADLELATGQQELECPQCDHSVPMLEEEDFYEIERDQQRREMLGYVGIGAFALAVLLFYLWTQSLEVVAIDELDRRRERLLGYRDEAHFALADSYDRTTTAHVVIGQN